MINEAQIKLFRDLFVNREDLFAYQCELTNESHEYCIRRTPLTDTLIVKHLEGKIIIASYSGFDWGTNDGLTKYVCININSKCEENVTRLKAKANNEAIPLYIEFSGNKDYHGWIFFNKYISNRQAKALGEFLAPEHEVFPVEDRVSQMHPGTPLKLPLGIYRETSRWCLFLDEELKPISNQWHFLSQAEKTDIDRLWDRLGEKISQAVVKDKEPEPAFKSFVDRLFNQEVPYEMRYVIAHSIVKEMQRLTKSPEVCQGVLECWNVIRNKSLLSALEIEKAVRAAYPEFNSQHKSKKTTGQRWQDSKTASQLSIL